MIPAGRNSWIIIFFSTSCSKWIAMPLQLLFFQLISSNIKLTATAHVASATTGCSFSQADCSLLATLNLDGELLFTNYSGHDASKDFGRLQFHEPAAVLYPSSVEDISKIVKFVYSSPNNITVAAKGAGHSIYGQAQAVQGIVIEMSGLKGIEVDLNSRRGDGPMVHARGGELWIDVVKETMRKGMAPRSLTDYLHLSVGGTLSNAGISGQAFRYGPQISNVLELEVVTGNGEVLDCSPHRNKDLFYSVLGGLGQFAIITKATIIIHPAPPKVKWVRAFYSDFAAFTRDQEMLISQDQENPFDYLEGFVIARSSKHHKQYRWKMESLSKEGQLNAGVTIISDAPVLYCLEITKGYYEHESNSISQNLDMLLAPLHHLQSHISIEDTNYLEFLERVHEKERHLQRAGLWDTPHPWMNLFIPKSRILEFDAFVFKHLVREGINGPMLIYPLNRNKWDPQMSAVTPEEDIFYLVGLLGYANPSSDPTAERLITLNRDILHFCNKQSINYTKYLPHYTKEDEWKTHFGNRWKTFLERKLKYDPKAILSPGQNIFTRSSISQQPFFASNDYLSTKDNVVAGDLSVEDNARSVQMSKSYTIG